MEETSLAEILEWFEENENLEFVFPEDLAGTEINFSFAGVPWRDALDTMLATHGLRSVVEEDKIRIERAPEPQDLDKLLRESVVLVRLEIHTARPLSGVGYTEKAATLPSDRFALVASDWFTDYESAERALWEELSLAQLDPVQDAVLMSRAGKDVRFRLGMTEDDELIWLDAKLSYAGAPSTGKLYIDTGIGTKSYSWLRASGKIVAGQPFWFGVKSPDDPYFVFISGEAMLGTIGGKPKRKEVRRKEVEGLLPPKKISGKSPKYPRKMYNSGLDGKVEMSLLIGVNGEVRDVKWNRFSHSDFRNALNKVIWDWKFRPGTNEGKPVEMWFDLDYEFYLY